jgi:RNA polymerase sigma-70 factor, ECF subfamily
MCPDGAFFCGWRMNEASRQSTDQIVQLLTNVQQQLTRYVRTLVPNRTDAEEVLQETNLFIWRHADEFELGTNFAAWACKIAYFQVLTFRKRQSRSRLRFSDELVEQLAQNAVPSVVGENSDAEALDLCMAKLSQPDRDLMDLRYEPGATVEGVAQRVGRSTKAIYAALGRIRTWLLECIQRTAAEARRQ